MSYVELASLVYKHPQDEHVLESAIVYELLTNTISIRIFYNTRQPLSTVDYGLWTKAPPELSAKQGLRKQHWTMDYFLKLHRYLLRKKRRLKIVNSQPIKPKSVDS
jgi:hypothetical protein